MRLKRGSNVLSVLLLVGVLCLGVSTVASAATTTTTLNQTVNPGLLTTSILDNTGAVVASPAVSFPAVNTSATCITSNHATLGTSTQRLYVSNLASLTTGWTLTIGATGGATATWSDGGTNSYSFNDPTGSTAGYTNGQMTVNPASGTATITDDCSSKCNDTGITQGTAAALDSGNSVTLLSGNTAIWRGYLTGIDLNQIVPAFQPAGTYTLGMTITVTGT